MTFRRFARLWHRLPAACGVLGIVAATALPADEPPSAASVYDRRSRSERGVGAAPPAAPTPRPQATAPAPQAERIVAGALAAMGRADTIAVRLRQKARIGDRVLVGTGRYVQSGRGAEQRFRHESTLECDTESFEAIDVCDGLFCWTYRRDGQQSEGLRRIDVRRVLEKIEAIDPSSTDNPAPYLGGLQRALWRLREWFLFDTVVTADLEGIDVWVTEGRWRPGMLTDVLPKVVEAAGGEAAVTATDLPDGVPWRVRIAVGRADLIVRRVEWLAIPGRRPAAGDIEPIAVLELFDIAIDGPVDAAAFFYQPATTGLIDVTDEHLELLSPLRP